MLEKMQVSAVVSVAVIFLLIGTLFNVCVAGSGRDREDRHENLWKAINEMQTSIDSLNASHIELLQKVQKLEMNQTQLLERIEILEEAIKPNVTVQDFIYDTFDGGLDNWTYWGDAGYYVLWVYPGILKILGDGFTVSAGIQKAVDLSGWNGSEPLFLSFNWRATSDTALSTVTNAYLRVEDLETHVPLYQETLAAGGVSDTDWQSYSTDIATYLAGHNEIMLLLGLRDGWITNYHQENWYDNLRLTNEVT
jgi:hypothetical protein